MQKLVLTLLSAAVISVGFGFAAADAEAKRLGGGSSFGMKRNITPTQPAAAPRPAQQAAPAAAPATAGAAAQAGKRSWLGPVAGLAAGLGLAALASHLGFGEEMASIMLILLLVVAAVFVFRLLTRSRQPQSALQYAGAGQGQPMHFESAMPAGGATKVGSGETATEALVPADFDVAGFLRQAKLNFLRLQAANDRGDLEDIRNFTTPEVFAELRMQFDERGRGAQQTDVQQLEADLLAVVTEEGQHIASVRFHGALQEDGRTPESFAEVWHLAKPVEGGAGWRIAGIQQSN